MRGPITFVYGNCVFAAGPEDCWAAFVVETSTYAWLSDEAKRARLLACVGAIEAIEADLQLLRVCGYPRAERHSDELDRPHDSGAARGPGGRLLERYVESQRARLASVGAAAPALFLLVSLREPARDVASYLSKAAGQHPRSWWESLRGALAARDRRLLRARELERARVLADRAHARLEDYLPVRAARGIELQWLIRRAFCRGIGEPRLDALHEPRALAFERNGEAVLSPLEGDVMRWGWLVPFRWFLSRHATWLYGWDSRQSVMPGHRRSRASRRRLRRCFGPKNPQNTRSRGSLVPFRWFLSRRDSWLYRWDSRQSSAGVEVSLEVSSRGEKSGKVSLGRGAPLNRQAPRSLQGPLESRQRVASRPTLVVRQREGREAGWRCRAPKVSSPASQKPKALQQLLTSHPVRWEVHLRLVASALSACTQLSWLHFKLPDFAENLPALTAWASEGEEYSYRGVRLPTLALLCAPQH
jgi:hypothetical protein